MKFLIRNISIMIALMLVLVISAPAGASAIRPGVFTTNTLPANDDGSTGPESIGFSINLFGSSFSQLYVNNNGNVTFNSPLSTFTPFGIQSSSIPIIAPFFGDVDTRTGNVLSYGQSLLGGHNAFGVNWFDVGYFSTNLNRLNTFQLVLTERLDIAAGDFDIEFNYGQIQWETGDASSGTNGLGGNSAAVGYSNGAGAYYEFVGSRVNGAFLDGGPNSLAANSNIGVAGRYLFEIRNGEVSNDPAVIPSAVPEPSTFILIMLGLAGIIGFHRTKKQS